MHTEDSAAKITSLPRLQLASVEFCFDTQAKELEMPYDLKIAQCYVAMHSFLQMELVELRHRDASSAEAKLGSGAGPLGTTLLSMKQRDHQFCKDLPYSLQQLSEYVYEGDLTGGTGSGSDSELAAGRDKTYAWMPSY